MASTDERACAAARERIEQLSVEMIDSDGMHLGPETDEQLYVRQRLTMIKAANSVRSCDKLEYESLQKDYED